MTVNISSLQTELLKLLNEDKEIPMETVLNQSSDVDEIVNKDLKGGDNIATMTENLLTGGDLNNEASSKEIVSNILMDDKKDIETNEQPADIIEQIVENNVENKDMEGGTKNKHPESNSSIKDEDEKDESNDENKSNDNKNDGNKDDNKNDDESSDEDDDDEDDESDDEDDESDDEDDEDDESNEENDENGERNINYDVLEGDDSDDSTEDDDSEDDDNDNLSSSYISIINEFSTPASKKKLSGGLVSSSSSHVKVIPMFPYIIKTEPQ